MIASLVLSALLADDGLTARDLAAVLGLSTAELRPVLRELVDAGAVVASGLASGTRYCLAIVEQLQLVAGPCACSVEAIHSKHHQHTAAWSAPRIGGPRVRLPKVRTEPATLDLLGALSETAALVLAGHDLPAIRAIALDRRQVAVAG